MTIGSPVISVKAIDDDVGQNAEVRYRFKQDLMGDWKTFSVDEITGLIALKKPLNKEIQKIYQVPKKSYFLIYSEKCKLIINEKLCRFVSKHMILVCQHHCRPI